MQSSESLEGLLPLAFADACQVLDGAGGSSDLVSKWVVRCYELGLRVLLLFLELVVLLVLEEEGERALELLLSLLFLSLETNGMFIAQACILLAMDQSLPEEDAL